MPSTQGYNPINMQVKEPEKSDTFLKPKDVQKIGEEINNICREDYTTSGLRIYGAPWIKIQQILEKYGFVGTIPF